MKVDLQQRLAEVIHKALGPSPSVEDVVKLLYDGGVVTDDTMRGHLIGREFFTRMQEAENPVPQQLMQDIAEDFGVGFWTVRYHRMHYVRGGKRRQRGARKK